MLRIDQSPTGRDLQEYGVRNPEIVHWNLPTAHLVEAALQRHEGHLASNGALVVRTGQFTGRSPKDKYIVRDELTESIVHWGPVNQPMTSEVFSQIYNRLTTFLDGHELFVQDCFAGADPVYRLPLRVIAQKAWHALFARQLFLRPAPEELAVHVPQFTILFVPDCGSIPSEDGTRSETCIAVDFTRRVVLIAGTQYAGEMKKSVFTLLNCLLPDAGVLPMHCSANVGADGGTALFFGLSGTGKTTLSADHKRRLIGDDEHGWSSQGVFNFEGGCYAKCIRLSREREPQIWDAVRFGTVLENVSMDTDTRVVDYDSQELTENTRAAYPMTFIEDAIIPGVAGFPSSVLFLTADAFGVLPPISRLTPDQAMYHFLSGYTAKLAGTERDLDSVPVPNFSACFGEPFLPRHPKLYAAMLGDKLKEHRISVWLVNTGWIRGPYGVGERINLSYTRRIVNAAIEGNLSYLETRPHPVFGVHVPQSCPGVPRELLDPRELWSDKAAYDSAARNLAARFQQNFKKFGAMDPAIECAGPLV